MSVARIQALTAIFTALVTAGVAIVGTLYARKDADHSKYCKVTTSDLMRISDQFLRWQKATYDHVLEERELAQGAQRGKNPFDLNARTAADKAAGEARSELDALTTFLSTAIGSCPRNS